MDLYDVDEAPAPGSPHHGDVEFFLTEARRTGGPVLELGVGTGRVALRLAEGGFRVTGLDLSPHMLAAARAKLAPGLKPRVRLVLGDMARFELGRKFGLVIIPFRAFQHLKTPEEQRSCLERVRAHLRRRGRFIVDLFDPRLDLCLPRGAAGPGPAGRGGRPDDGDVLRPAVRAGRVRHPATGLPVDIEIRDRVNDPLSQTFTERWIYTERDRRGRVARRAVRRLALRWTYRWEMRHLLELAGFRVLACYGDFMKGPPRYGAEQVWVADIAPSAGEPRASERRGRRGAWS